MITTIKEWKEHINKLKLNESNSINDIEVGDIINFPLDFKISELSGFTGTINSIDGDIAFIKIANNEEPIPVDVYELTDIYENDIDTSILEEYPSSFDMIQFKLLKSFKDRVTYCDTNLKKIGAGTSRIVYQIDEQKVLKLAKNAKGISQNEIEITQSNYNDLGDIIAKVYNYEENSLWLEMESARKLSKNEFKSIIGFSFDDFCIAIHNYKIDVDNHRAAFYKKEIDKNIVEQMWENEFIYGVFNFIGDYNIPVVDLQRLSSYGIVKRDGQDGVVLVDYGLNNDVLSTHYKK
jgi:hypothetical protein